MSSSSDSDSGTSRFESKILIESSTDSFYEVYKFIDPSDKNALKLELLNDVKFNYNDSTKKKRVI